MDTFYLKDISDGRNYHPIFKLVKIDSIRMPISPKVGDILDQWDIEALIINGCRIVLDPKDAGPAIEGHDIAIVQSITPRNLIAQMREEL